MKNLWILGLLSILVIVSNTPNQMAVENLDTKTIPITHIEISVAERILSHSVCVYYKSAEGSLVLGSGVMYTRNNKCYVMTAAHVISDAKTHGGGTILVSFTSIESDISTSEWKGTIVAYNKDLDAAIIELNDAKPNEIHGASFAADVPKVGREVYAIGNPMGEINTVTEGIICHNHRPVSWCKQRHYQISCNGAPGSSGGGVFTADTGECIGLVVRLSAASRILVVVPTNEIFGWLVADNLCEFVPDKY